jgi:hypothetical protein
MDIPEKLATKGTQDEDKKKKKKKKKTKHNMCWTPLNMQTNTNNVNKM